MSDQLTRTKTIIRVEHDKEHPYVMVARATIEDRALSYEALGLLVFLLSKPDHWQTRPTGLARDKAGRDKVHRLLVELQSAGYVTVEHTRGEKQKFDVNRYTIHEKPFTEKPLTALPSTANPPLVSNEDQAINQEAIKTPTSGADAPKAAASKPRDLLYDAIADGWETTASGFIVCVKAMMLGKAKKGTWAQCNFNPPVENVADVTDFIPWYKSVNPLLSLPKQPMTIQEWFYQFRQSRTPKAYVPPPPVGKTLPPPLVPRSAMKASV